jgi:hypothetical protein
MEQALSNGNSEKDDYSKYKTGKGEGATRYD